MYTLALNECLKISVNDLAKNSDLPVSVAYKIVHLTLFCSCLSISLTKKLTTLEIKRKFNYYLDGFPEVN